MRIQDPRAAGLYTLCEADEDDCTSKRPLLHSLITPTGNQTPSPPTDLISPGSDNEDPFSFDSWSTGDLQSPCESEKAVTPPPPRPIRRPPPLDLTFSGLGLRYPRSPYCPTTGITRRNNASSTIRPPRVTSPTAHPRTPTILPNDSLLPPLPIADDKAAGPQTPVSQGTPTFESNDKLFSALRELLTSCGEFDDFADMFDGSDPATVGGSSSAVPTTSESVSTASRVAGMEATPMTPSRSFSVPMADTPDLRPRRRSTFLFRTERPLATYFHDHTFLQSLSLETTETLPLCLKQSPVNVDKPLPRLDVSEADSDEESDDDACSFRSSASIPGLSPSPSSSSLASSVSSYGAYTPDAFGARSAQLYSLPNTASMQLHQTIYEGKQRQGRRLPMWV